MTHSIERSIEAIESLTSLNIPILERLLPIAYHFDKQGVSRSGRSIKLIKFSYPDQVKAGIVRCMGFDIIWI